MAAQGSGETDSEGPTHPGPTLPAASPESAGWIAPRWAWGIFTVLFLAHLLDSFDRWLLPVVLRDISQELSLSDIQAGWLATLLLLSYAICSPLVGYISDRLGRPRLLAVGIAVWSLACVGTGLARSYFQLQLVRVLVGIGGATFGVVALTLLMDVFPRGARARALAFYYLAMPVGAALGLGIGAAVARAATWHTAFLMVGAPGLVLALLALGLPDPLRGTSEGVEPRRLKMHETVGPSQADYIDLMVNSSFNYAVFGLSFSMFAIGGLVFWLPTFLLVVHDLPAARISSWLGITVPAAMVLGMVIGGWLGDRYVRIAPRSLFLVPGTAMLAAIPFLLLAIYGKSESAIYLGVFVSIALMCTNAGPCYAIIANVVMPNMRAVACAVAVAAMHLLGDIWSPTLMAWVAETFGQADSMATPFGQALASLGAVPSAQPGHDPENLIAALLTAVPALLIAGVVLLAGAWHLPREMALMLAKLRALPTRSRSSRPNPQGKDIPPPDV